MRSLLFLTSLISVFFIFFICVGAEKIIIEAEAFQSIKKPFIKVKKRKNSFSEKLSGNCYIEIRQGAGNGSKVGGEVSYNIKISEGGEYIFWARVWWLDSCGNSFIFIFDKQSPVIFGNDGTYKAWHWMKSGIKLKLSKGMHILSVKNREDGIKIDQFIITDDQSFQPIGIEK